MERLAILDHAAHKLYIEDVTDEMLQPYNGSEEDYIKDNYTFEGDFSWEYIVGAEYYPTTDPTPMDIDFDTLVELNLEHVL